MNSEKQLFEVRGFLDPFQLFTEVQCAELKKNLQKEVSHPPIDWDKGYAVNSRLFFEMASHTLLINRLKTLLGNDILLWGASLITKPAGAFHPWHCDIESTAIEAGETVSVWIGLENTSKDSSIQLIPYSHRFNKSVQQVGFEKEVDRAHRTTEKVLEWAQELDPDCTVQYPEVKDGSVIFFHGKIWHASQNRSDKPRTAILLQYASPSARIRIPDGSGYDWPFQQLTLPKPPCILICGDDRFGVNRIVSGPVSSRITTRVVIAKSRVHSLELPLPLPKSVNWKPFYIFNGKTPELDQITCHISALRSGFLPHPPHTHREEELLIVLDGEVDVILPEIPSPNGDHRHPLRRGQFVYYPANFAHTIEAKSELPANYLMIKWYSEVPERKNKLPFVLSTTFDYQNGDNGKSINYQTLFEGPTASLDKLHCHTTMLQPGASYAAHIDPYDVAIIVLEGTVESLGEKIEAGAVIFYPSGQPHEMSNPTDAIAKYVVFEFHGAKQYLTRLEPPDTNVHVEKSEHELNSLQKALEIQTEELNAIRSSYSLKFGRFITRSIASSVGWIPAVKRWILNLSNQNR